MQGDDVMRGGSRAFARWLAPACGLVTIAASPVSSAGCNVSATALPFGAYNPASAGPADATGTVTVTCNVLVALGLSWTVKMSRGTSATYSPRTLSNGAATLSYNIYTTSARTTVWGDG